MNTYFVIASKLGYIDTNLEVTFQECNKKLFETIGEAMKIASEVNNKLGAHIFKIYSIYSYI